MGKPQLKLLGDTNTSGKIGIFGKFLVSVLVRSPPSIFFFVFDTVILYERSGVLVVQFCFV